MDLGAAGVMVAPPASLRTDDQIVAYYATVVETIGAAVPLVLQDYPLATGVLITARHAPRASSRPTRASSCSSTRTGPASPRSPSSAPPSVAARRRVSILCGNGGLFLPEELRRGADGAMTGFAFPEMMVEVCRLTAAGDHARAQDLFDAYLPLVRYEQQPGIGLAVRKYVLAKRGAIASAAQRRPGAGLPAEAAAEVEVLRGRQGRRLKQTG